VQASDAGALAPATAVSGSRLLRRLRSEPLGMLGLVLVAMIVICGLTADWVTPYDPFKIRVPDRFLAPELAHPMGTDSLGRDVLSRVMKGSQIALIVGVSSVALSLAIGLVLGLIAGYGPRWLDNSLLLLFDTIYSFPVVMLGLAVITLLGSSLTTLMIVVVIVQTPGYARLVRTATLSVKNSEFILAERAMGASPARVLARHILPNIIGPLLIIGSMDIPSVITLEAGLSFLGLGLPDTIPAWGNMLAEGERNIFNAGYLSTVPGLAITVTVWSVNLLGDGLRRALDPHLRNV
jgi:peptide/nickel transport system permease protein